MTWQEEGGGGGTTTMAGGDVAEGSGNSGGAMRWRSRRECGGTAVAL